MLLQTVLYLTSVVSAIALIALILVQDRPESRPDSAASQGLRRATVWSTGLFLTSALLIALADVRTTGSLLDHVERPQAAGVASATDAAATVMVPVAVDPLAR
ncbi:MAG: hypothetical protein ACYSWX_00870 [Planctomycetota bacterium]|jgi:preprotein translocase subunit SecG